MVESAQNSNNEPQEVSNSLSRSIVESNHDLQSYRDEIFAASEKSKKNSKEVEKRFTKHF